MEGGSFSRENAILPRSVVFVSGSGGHAEQMRRLLQGLTPNLEGVHNRSNRVWRYWFRDKHARHSWGC